MTLRSTTAIAAALGALAIGAHPLSVRAAPGGSCARLPPDAAVTVKAPLDRYMQLICNNRTGQGLRAAAGSHWANQQGLGLDLSASKQMGPDAQGRVDFPFSWYRKLETVSLSEAEQRAMLKDLNRLFVLDKLGAATVLEVTATTSNGEEKRVVLVVPRDGEASPKWLFGVECNGACFREDPQPMAFAGSRN
jgi:hypothetical protein